jgi:peptidyl-prolyl cis-trans isomerase D
MISWIQRSFQQHFRVVFGLLLAVMIISFIFTIGSTPGIGRTDRRLVVRDYFGHNLDSRDEVVAMDSDARLSAYLMYGRGLDGDQLRNYALVRTAALHLGDALHLPASTPTEITDFIKGLRIFAGSGGQFDVARYDSFRNSLKTGSLSEADIARVVAQDARAYKVERLLGGPGYLLAGDIKTVLLRGDTVWTIATATADYASFDPGINPTEAELVKFFTDNGFRYTVPPLVEVDYVDFPASSYIPKDAPAPSEVKEYYDAHAAQFAKTPALKTPVAKPDPAADFLAVEPKVRDALQLEKAKRNAIRAASDFAYSLYENKITRGASLDGFLAAHKISAKSLKPFSHDDGPAEFSGSRTIADAAFGLNGDRYFSEAMPSPEGAVVLLWKDLLAAHPPMLAEVRNKVRADAIDDLKRKRFTELGASLKAAIERRLAAGETFEKAAGESGGAVKLALKTYPPFTIKEQPHDVDPAVIGALEHLSKGHVSDMQLTAEKGYLVYAADEKAPALSESDPRYVQVKAQLAYAFSRTDSDSILTEVMENELKRTDPTPKKPAP